MLFEFVVVSDFKFSGVGTVQYYILLLIRFCSRGLKSHNCLSISLQTSETVWRSYLLVTKQRRDMPNECSQVRNRKLILVRIFLSIILVLIKPGARGKSVWGGGANFVGAHLKILAKRPIQNHTILVRHIFKSGGDTARSSLPSCRAWSRLKNFP